MVFLFTTSTSGSLVCLFTFVERPNDKGPWFISTLPSQKTCNSFPFCPRLNRSHCSVSPEPSTSTAMVQDLFIVQPDVSTGTSGRLGSTPTSRISCPKGECLPSQERLVGMNGKGLVRCGKTKDTEQTRLSFTPVTVSSSRKVDEMSVCPNSSSEVGR